MTTEEKQEIINAVLSAIRTNSKTINQLTTVSELTDADYFELDGGRKVSYGVLMSVLDNYVTGTAMQEAMLGVALLGDNSVLDWKQSPIVLLESMGPAFDDVDGGTFGFTPVSSDVPEGTLYYAPQSGYQIFEKTGPGSSEGWHAKTGVIYLNKHTRRFYTWDGEGMVEFGNNRRALVIIDDMSCTDLNDIALGKVGYFPSTKKLTTRIDTRKWWSWSPNMSQLYCDKANNTTLRWDSENERFVSIGGGGGNGMPAETYDAIQNNVETLRLWCNALRDALANLAFNTSKPGEVSEFVWPGGDTEVPSISLNKTSLEFSAQAEDSVTQSFVIQGYNLAGAITIALAGPNQSLFTLSQSQIAASQANGRTTISVTYSPTEAGTHSATLYISCVGVESKTIILTGTASAAGQTTHAVEVVGTRSHCAIVGTVPSTVSDGGSVTIAIAPDTGYTLSGVSVQASATNGNVSTSYNSSTGSATVTVEDITADTTIAINAIATEIASAAINLKSGYTLSKSGSEQSIAASSDTAGWYTETYIPIPSGAKALLWNHGCTLTNSGNNYRCLVFYKSDYSIVSSSSGKSANSDSSSDKGWRKFNVPTGAAYVRASFVNALAGRFIKYTTDSAGENATNDLFTGVLFDEATSNYTIDGQSASQMQG